MSIIQSWARSILIPLRATRCWSASGDNLLSHSVVFALIHHHAHALPQARAHAYTHAHTHVQTHTHAYDQVTNYLETMIFFLKKLLWGPLTVKFRLLWVRWS